MVPVRPQPPLEVSGLQFRIGNNQATGRMSEHIEAAIFC